MAFAHKNIDMHCLEQKAEEYLQTIEKSASLLPAC
jgi:hypothetical protein